MSSEASSSTHSRQRPNFSSDLPPALLDGCSPQQKWLMESISCLKQTTDWQTDELLNHAEKLERIEAQTIRTNGRVTKVEERLLGHDGQFKKIGEDLATYKWTKKVLGTKWGAAAALGVFFLATFVASYLYHHFGLIPTIIGKVFGA